MPQQLVVVLTLAVAFLALALLCGLIILVNLVSKDEVLTDKQPNPKEGDFVWKKK